MGKVKPRERECLFQWGSDGLVFHFEEFCKDLLEEDDGWGSGRRVGGFCTEVVGRLVFFFSFSFLFSFFFFLFSFFFFLFSFTLFFF